MDYDPDPTVCLSLEFMSGHWSLVVKAGSHRSPEAHAVLSRLCTAYWYPIYAFMRRKGNGRDQALVLTQEFFACLLENDNIAERSPCKGRFRTYLRTNCEHFLIDQFPRTTSTGRGLPADLIDAQGAEDRYGLEPADTLTTDRFFDRTWAMTLMDRALNWLAREYASRGASQLFDQIKIVLFQGNDAVSAGTVAAQFGKSEKAVNIALHQLRKRHRDSLEEQVAATLDDPSEMEDEIRSLFEAITT
jgi:DNA-directed RNA polymerase specialized sigma24 family protein